MPQQQLRVVIIDDDDIVRRLLASVVSMNGHRVVGTAGNGTDGLQLILHLRPDLTFLDNAMPGRMSGLVVLVAMRDDPQLANLKVILHTSDQDGVQQASEALGAHFLAKPSTPMEILAAINALFPDEGKTYN